MNQAKFDPVLKFPGAAAARSLALHIEPIYSTAPASGSCQLLLAKTLQLQKVIMISVSVKGPSCAACEENLQANVR